MSVHQDFHDKQAIQPPLRHVECSLAFQLSVLTAEHRGERVPAHPDSGPQR